MSALSIQVPFPVFQDRDGQPLDNGYVWVGVANLNPQTNPIVAYYDAALTIPAVQPLRTINGYISNAGTPAQIYVDAVNFSILVQDSKGSTVYSFADGTGVSPNASGVIYDPAGTGAVQTNVQDKLRQLVSVKDFGATGDGVTDDTTAIQAAITFAGTGTGNTVYFPAGTYICSAPINMAKYVTLQGAGQIASTLKWNTTGIGIQMISPINSSTGVFNSINDLGLTCTNVSNTGGGYVDVGGSYINMTNVLIVGFKYGVILDQSELVDIDLCHFTLQTTGGVWLANANYTGGTAGDFTNRISIKRSQFNSSNVTTIGIIDDGGYSHVFEDNNYNGCVNHIRLSGGKSVNIRGGEFEAASSTSILMSSTTHTGSVSGSSTNVLLDGCLLVPTVGNNCVTAVCGQLTIINCFFGNTASAKVTGLSTTASFFEAGNSSGGGGALYSGTPTSNFQTTDYGSFTPVLTINNSSVGITGTFNGRYQKINQVVTFSIEIVLTSKGASAGSVVITGLPYSEATTIGQVVPVSLATGIVTATSIGAIVTGTTIALYNANVNFSAALTNANISDTTALYLSGSYFIS